MVLIITATILILAMALFQAIQGVFSALLMAILTILCAALSFALYEPLAQLLYARQPAYADAAALMAIFVLSLLGSRLLADRFIPGNVVLGVWANRLAGGLLGLLTGTVIVGMLTVALQMLPFGASVVTFRPFDDSLQRRQRLRPFCCDQFTVGLARMLSAGAFSSRTRLASQHDNLLLEAFCARNTAGLNGRIDALPDALSSVEVCEPPNRRLVRWVDDVPPDPLLKPDEPTRLIVVRCQIDASARDGFSEGGTGQRWRLPATHFRLVTSDGQSHYPLAYLTHETDGERARKWQAHAAAVVDGRAQVAQLAVVRPATREIQSLTVDWAYRIGEGQEPQYVAFRRVAKKPVTKDNYRTDQMPDARYALDRRGLLEPSAGAGSQ